MFLMRFTERAYYHYTEEDVRNSYRSAVRLTFPNSHFDTAKASHMYNYYLDEYEYSEEVGFDGLMLNEHHNTPTCMGAAMNLEAAILARTTKKPKIVLLGNPLPIQENPIRMAEELAEMTLSLAAGSCQASFAAQASNLGRRTPILSITVTAFRKPTTSSSRHGLRPAPSAGKASTMSSAWLTLSCAHCKSRTRLYGCPAAPAPRR